VEGIVMTMFDGRTNLANQVVEEVRKHFTDKVFKTVIPRTVRLSEAPSFGKPIIHYDRHSAGATAYLALAKEFLKRQEAAEKLAAAAVVVAPPAAEPSASAQAAAPPPGPVVP
jgi:chromosome partitioning protein